MTAEIYEFKTNKLLLSKSEEELRRFQALLKRTSPNSSQGVDAVMRFEQLPRQIFGSFSERARNRKPTQKRRQLMSTKTIIEPKTIGQLNEEVQKGLEIAREAVKDDKNAEILLETLRQMHNAWSELLHQVIVMAVSISAMKYRTPEQIIAQVAAISASFQEQKEDALRRYQYKSAFNQ